MTARMTATEYSQLPETNQIMELINGVLIPPRSNTALHQRTLMNLAMFLVDLLQNGDVMIAPMDVYFDNLNVIQPDLFWLAPESKCIEREANFYGPPELVVEVLSPATATRDRREKFAVYEEHGVIEYWIVDPSGNHIEVWTRKEGRFQRVGIFTEGDTFTSAALDKAITLYKLFTAE